jgi:hypothetical protein
MPDLERDTSPIDQRWINDYCGQWLKIAERLPTGAMRDAALLRAEYVMDLVEAWQERKAGGKAGS